MRRRANMRWDAEDEPCTRMYCLVQVDSRTYSVAARTFLLYDRAEVFIKPRRATHAIRLAMWWSCENAIYTATLN
jgi:hypothetical protein